MSSERQCIAALINVPFQFDKNNEVNISSTVKKFKKHLTSFCESILFRVDGETDFFLLNYKDENNPKPHQFIVGKEIAPFTLNLVELTFEVADKVEFLTKANFEEFNRCGEDGMVVIMHINGNFHWDYNFPKASDYMDGLKYSYDSYFKLFGFYEDNETEYFIESSYENGGYEDGFMPYFEEAGNDITSGYVTQFMEDAAYNDLDYYSLKREIFDLQWFKK
jgi:hypothetical protein